MEGSLRLLRYFFIECRSENYCLVTDIVMAYKVAKPIEKML